ncbi:MAG: 30S ribosomal protein S16 [bacterium]
MLAIKLARFGKKKMPQFRLVVLEKTADPWGDYMENLGTMDPRAKDGNVKFNIDRIKYWIEKGAQPTDTVRNLLIDMKVIKGEKAKTIRMSKERTAKIAETKGKAVAEAEAKVKAAAAAKEKADAEAKAAKEAEAQAKADAKAAAEAAAAAPAPTPAPEAPAAEAPKA